METATGKSTNGTLISRTKEFALRVVRLVNALPPTKAANVIGHQLLRCATSVGANYRAACRSRSPKEFCARLGVVEEEADESAFWLELLVESDTVAKHLLDNLLTEAHAITAMVVSSIKTVRAKIREKRKFDSSPKPR